MENGIEIKDIYNNPLISLAIEETDGNIIDLSGMPPYLTDVSFVAALTSKGHLYSFDFRPTKVSSPTLPQSGVFHYNIRYKQAFASH